MGKRQFAASAIRAFFPAFFPHFPYPQKLWITLWMNCHQMP